jgi:hypothetical protein
MNPSPFLRHLFELLLTGILLLGFSGPLCAGDGGRKLLKMEISKDRRSALVEVPSGYSEVVLQRFERESGWRKVATKTPSSRIVKFKLPSTGKDLRWRAIGRFNREAASRGKFPAAFYRGKNAFGAIKGGKNGKGAISRNVTGMFDEAAPDLSGGVIPEEADIWKTDGNTVYFFNQLRGLQVLDVTDPADPRLTASLRLAAEGEDLYLLPGSGSARHLALLTRRYVDHSSVTRINLVRVNGGNIEIIHRRDVPGELSDSRMIGNRLVLATTEWGGDENAATTSRLTQWLITPGYAPQAAGDFLIDGDYPVISAGPDWLALAATPSGEWGFSDVTVFGLEKSGLVRLNGKPHRTAGTVADKFKMQWKDNVLTTISEKFRNESDWTPVTVLENFRVWGAGVIHPAVVEGRLGSLELADGESLFATRFAGDKAYIVTFLQTDPLWVLDLSDPKKPIIAGELKVPGWSSHLEPIGDLLLSIGWESDTVAASLFDVANPAAPKLLRRLNLGTPGSYSEASWDEQALKVLTEVGLAMIPLTSYDRNSGKSNSVVQLLDLDLIGGDLKPRGTIAHAFDARRSDLLGKSVVSISQRVLVTADIADRDKPAVLAEVSLAWPVDRVLDAGAHMIQIEDGDGYGYSRATARVTPANSTEAVLTETDLGDGVVRGADLRGGKLHMLREIRSSSLSLKRSPVIGDVPDRLVLDVYDALALPALKLLGSVSTNLKAGIRVSGDGLLWPQPNRPTVLLDAVSSFWYGWDFPMIRESGRTITSVDTIAPSGGLDYGVDAFPYWRPKKAPRLLAFDTSDPSVPSVGSPVVIGTNETIPNGVVKAGDGMVVIGAGNWKNEATGEAFAPGQVMQSAHVIEVGVSADPVVRPGIDLPGELFAVTQLDREGFLAFTRNFESGDEPAFKISACDGLDAYEIAGLDENPAAAATAGGRRLYVAKKGSVKRHLLTDAGVLTEEPDLEVGWKAEQLRCTNGTLLGSKWNALFAAAPDAKFAKKWNFPTWSLWLDNVNVAGDGDLLVPFGEYGAEHLER